MKMTIDRSMGLKRRVVVPLGLAMEIIRLQDLHKEQRKKGLTCKATKTYRKLAILIGGIDGL